MTPKERVLAALAHREPDRVPHGEFATDHSGIEQAPGRPTYWRGRRRLTEALWAGKRDEVVAGRKRDIIDCTLKLGIDMVPANAPGPRRRHQHPSSASEWRILWPRTLLRVRAEHNCPEMEDGCRSPSRDGLCP